MKVLVICGAGMVSGKEIMTLNLIEGLKGRNHECLCITSSWGSQDFKNRLGKMGIRYFVLRIGFISKTLNWSAIRMTLHQFIYLPVLYTKFLWIITKYKPDVLIHTNFHHLFLLFPFLPRTSNLYWSHEIMSQSRFYRKLFRVFDRRIGLFIGVSDAVAKSMIPFVGADKVRVIKNGISPPVVVREIERTNNRFVLAIIGQVGKHKGHDILFEALKEYRQYPIQISLKIIGNGDIEYVKYLKNLAYELGLEEIIEWRGFIMDVCEIYDGIDMVIVPSIEPDPYPTTIMESGFYGLPVIASNIGGIPEMIIHGYNGFVFETGNSKALSEILWQALTSYDMEKLSVQARKHAITRFTRERFVTDFENILELSRDKKLSRRM